MVLLVPVAVVLIVIVLVMVVLVAVMLTAVILIAVVPVAVLLVIAAAPLIAMSYYRIKSRIYRYTYRLYLYLENYLIGQNHAIGQKPVDSGQASVFYRLGRRTVSSISFILVFL